MSCCVVKRTAIAIVPYSVVCVSKSPFKQVCVTLREHNWVSAALAEPDSSVCYSIITSFVSAESRDE